MTVAAMVSISSPHIGIAALVLAVVVIAIVILRGIHLPMLAAMMLCCGVICLALAAGEPIWHRSTPGTLAVMVDLSPSTRGARFRDGGLLRARVWELVGDYPCRFVGFADHTVSIDPSGTMAEMPADETRFSPADADMILLFSDGRFDLPKASPPVYAVVDGNLENISDARVEQLEVRGGNLAATISDSGSERAATLEGATEPKTVAIDPGRLVITRPISSGASVAAVKLNAGDLWPENDSLSVRVAADPVTERWWVGENPPGGWRSFAPASLPIVSSEYLAPAIIVIKNQAADLFTRTQLDCLMEYVRDLGGSLVIVGGDHAFAAGGYPGTALETLSPLASSPPDATRRWVLLVDGSGSMGMDAGGGVSRWQIAARAAVQLLASLPPSDLVQIGQFSDVVRWWIGGKSAAEAARTPLPPVDAFPHGPTNLESALNEIARDAGESLPTELLLLSDCDTTFEHPKELGELLVRRKIRLDVLAIGRGSGLDVVWQICAATGGNIVEQFDPREWAKSMEKLSRAALPDRVSRGSITVVFENGAKFLPQDDVGVWNRTWLKPQAERWAGAKDEGLEIPMAGYWRVGSGCVAAVAFDLDDSRAVAIAEKIAARPRDPRFSVRWENGRRVRVIVDAVDGGRFLNGLPIMLA
ncbi:MAG TPA: vWA domain-containing protein, partial [Tepidisphaeraceae bacterium]